MAYLRGFKEVFCLYLFFIFQIGLMEQRSVPFYPFFVAEIQRICHSIRHFSLSVLKHMAREIAGRAYTGIPH